MLEMPDRKLSDVSHPAESRRWHAGAGRLGEHGGLRVAEFQRTRVLKAALQVASESGSQGMSVTAWSPSQASHAGPSTTSSEIATSAWWRRSKSSSHAWPQSWLPLGKRMASGRGGCAVPSSLR